MGNFKQRFGTWCSLNSVNAVDVICSTDLDFVIIDEEHSSVSFAGMEIWSARVRPEVSKQ